MKKEELQKAYEEQKREAELWKARFLSLKTSIEDNSKDYQRRSDMAYQKNMMDMYKMSAEIRSKELMQLREENRLLTEDNERLLEDFKVKYRPGIVEREKMLNEILSNQDEITKYHLESMKKANTELKMKVEEQAILIAYLKTLINDKIFDEDRAGEEIKKAYEQYQKEVRKPAHETIDADTRARIFKLREEGFSMRKIAKMEQVSLGAVHKIIHSTEKENPAEE